MIPILTFLWLVLLLAADVFLVVIHQEDWAWVVFITLGFSLIGTWEMIRRKTRRDK